MTSPFDWKGQPSSICMKAESSAMKNSHQQTAVINRRRLEGIEPSIVYSTKPKKMIDLDPKRFAHDIPVMPYSKSHKQKLKNGTR